MKTYTILFLLFFFSLEISAQSNPFGSDLGTLNLMEIDVRDRDKVMLLPRTDALPFTLTSPSLMYHNIQNKVTLFHGSNKNYIEGDNLGNGIATRDLIVTETNKIKQNNNRMISVTNGSIELLNLPSGDSYEYKMQNDGNFVTYKNGVAVWSSNLSIQKHKANQNIITNRWGIRNSEVPDSRNTKMIRMRVRLNPNVYGTIIAARQDNLGNRFILAIQADGGLHIYNTRGTHDPHPDVSYGTFLHTGRALRNVSDRRVKYVLAPMENVLDRVAKMEIIEYKYKKEVAHLGMTMAPLRIGFIAQDVIQLFPRYTATLSKYSPETNRYTLYYKFFSLLALKSIQDFKTREDKEIYDIEKQIQETAEKEKITQLENKVKFLDQEIKYLEEKLYSLNKDLEKK